MSDKPTAIPDGPWWIKPLVWEKARSLEYGDSWTTKTILGYLGVFRYYSIKQRKLLDCFTWTYGDDRRFKTPEAAQLAAESWYRERLRPALKPVEVKDA